MSQYRILDGLQRTYRIHEIWKCMKYFSGIQNKDELLEMNKIKLARILSKDLIQLNYDINVFVEILNEYKRNGNIDRYWRYYKENIQWFEVWENLTSEQEMQKKLILNAGHKQMDIRHQLELLFLNLLPELNEQCRKVYGKEIIRNKENSDMQYSKERVQGEYYFSHIISSVISYVWKQPVTTNASLVNDLQQDNNNMDECISYSQLKSVMSFLISLDDVLKKEYGEIGTKWISRETVLVGIFAALGIAKREREESDDEIFFKFLDKVKFLNLSGYEKAKQNNIVISKVNIGNVTKKAVMKAVLDLLKEEKAKIIWEDYFGGNE